MKRLALIFVFAFLTNLLWEFTHARLYVHYMGGEITNLILIRATFWDAVIIAAVALPFLLIPILKKNSWIIIPIGVAIAVIIEVFALGTSRWAYGSSMPLVFGLGLTPLIQLGLLGYVSFQTAKYVIKER